jgi:uncharacterized protein YbjT (DUF2867 family)
MKVLITTGNGMFGGALIRALQGSGVQIRALVRNPDKLRDHGPDVEVFQGNLDDPGSVERAVARIDKVFLSTPMDAKIAERECRVIDKAAEAGVRQIIKIYGAVEHGDDPLVTQHNQAIERLKSSGISWALVSPNSVLETSILSNAPFVAETGSLFGISGHGKIGFVALQDVARVAAHVVCIERKEDINYEVTGPKAVDLYEVAAALSQAVGKEISYVDMPEEEFASDVQQATGMPAEAVETAIVCHLRCWRDGKAEKVTDTFRQLTGKAPTSVEQWAALHADAFRSGQP